MEKRNRNTAIFLIGAGSYLIFGSLVGYFTVTAILIVVLAMVKIRANEKKLGYILLAVAVVMLLNDHFVAMVAAIFILLGLYYFRTQNSPNLDGFRKRQSLLESLKWDQKQWELHDTHISSVIGEIRMDFSLAVMGQKETTVMLQGVIGDVDLTIPEDIGIRVRSSIFIGETEIDGSKEAGMPNKTEWQSADYESSEYKINLDISYFVGDVKIRML